MIQKGMAPKTNERVLWKRLEQTWAVTQRRVNQAGQNHSVDELKRQLTDVWCGGAALNSQFLTRLLTSGEEDFERVSLLKEDTSSTRVQLVEWLWLLILCISVTFSVTCLTVASLYEIMSATLASTFLIILQGNALADLGFGGIF